jgi:molecular chaperone DnaJ
VADEDYYAVLGVPRTATDEDLKRAYRRLARELHPDTGHGDPANEERFKLVNRAYETLKDPARRRQYDTVGADGPRGGDPFSGFNGGAGLGDIFEAFFGGGSPFGASANQGRRGGVRRGEDAEAVVDLEFAEAVLGVQRELSVQLPGTCETCAGTGARAGTTAVTCSTCGGAGEIRRVKQTLLGQMVSASPCPRCGGLGQEIPSPCPDCRGDGRRPQERTFMVDIPAGVDGGSTLRLTGRGAAGPRGGPPGDLYVHLRVRPHETLTRAGNDLHVTLHVSMTQAALGAHLSVESLEGVEEVAVNPGTPSGRELRLRGKGVPHLQGRGRGDLVVTLVVDTPTELTRSQEELLRRLAEERGEEVAPPESGLLSRLRGAFK